MLLAIALQLLVTALETNIFKERYLTATIPLAAAVLAGALVTIPWREAVPLTVAALLVLGAARSRLAEASSAAIQRPSRRVNQHGISEAAGFGGPHASCDWAAARDRGAGVDWIGSRFASHPTEGVSHALCLVG